MKSRRDSGRPGEEERDFAALIRSMSRNPGVTQARMFGREGLRVNGRFFAVKVRGRLVVKLPVGRVKEVIARKQGRQFYHIYDPNRIMREWVSVEASGDDWLELAREARDFVTQIEAGRKSRNRKK